MLQNVFLKFTKHFQKTSLCYKVTCNVALPKLFSNFPGIFREHVMFLERASTYFPKCTDYFPARCPVTFIQKKIRKRATSVPESNLLHQ